MLTGVPPPGPLIPVISPVTAATTAQATQKQAAQTGAQSNDSLQNSMQATRNSEERKKTASRFVGARLAVGTLDALAALPNSKGRPHNEEDEHDSSGHNGPFKRRKKRRVPPLVGF